MAGSPRRRHRCVRRQRGYYLWPPAKHPRHASLAPGTPSCTPLAPYTTRASAGCHDATRTHQFGDPLCLTSRRLRCASDPPQVGCVWAAAGILSYSLGGSFSLVEPATGQILSTQVRSPMLHSNEGAGCLASASAAPPSPHPPHARHANALLPGLSLHLPPHRPPPLAPPLPPAIPSTPASTSPAHAAGRSQPQHRHPRVGRAGRATAVRFLCGPG